MEDKTDKQQQFIELRAKGNSFDNIAKKLKVSKGTLISWSKNFDLEIKNQTSVEMDSLRDKLALTKNTSSNHTESNYRVLERSFQKEI